jgi:hypothetical protein
MIYQRKLQTFLAVEGLSIRFSYRYGGLMNGLWAGYIYGEFGSVVARWNGPANILAEASLHLFEGPPSGRDRATIWIRSVAVRNPSTGAVTELPSDATVPMRFENNAVSVTFGINTTDGVEAEGLIHVFSWP